MLELNAGLLFQKLILGITLAAPIGPVSIEMIKRGLQKGFLSAFSVRLGGALGNVACLLGTYYGLFQILMYPMVSHLLGGLGGLLLIYMGTKTLQKGIKDADLEGDVRAQNGLRWGFYLAIANPVAFVFWPGIFAANIDPNTPLEFTGFLTNLFIVAGVLMWGAALSAVLAFGHRFFTTKTIVRISQMSALFMFYFGGKYLWIILERLLECF